MRFGIHTLDEFEVSGRVVLCRIDINQPVDKKTGNLRDITRIKACVPTVRELAERGARVVLLAHQGSDIEYKNFYSTRPHSKVLSELLGREVQYVEDVCGPAACTAIRSLKNGQVLLLDNVRYCSEEQTLFELKLKLTHEEQAQTQVVRKLAPLADIFICDAFAAAHRDQPSLCGFEQVLPSAMGRLFEREYCVISDMMENPKRPCLFLLGGAKVNDAFLMMRSVLENGAADRVLTGGLVANILLLAKGKHIGRASEEFIERSNNSGNIRIAKELWENYGERILTPIDLAGTDDGKRCEYTLDTIPEMFGALDIGSRTAKAYAKEILAANTVFVNGPMGVFEQAETELGTRTVWEALGETQAYTVIGGGDSITATKKYGKTDQINYICTGGGALIRFLSGEELPAVRALRDAALRE